MAGRTLDKWARVYVDGYDISGYGRTIGPLVWEFEAADLTAPMSDAVRGCLPNLCNISPGTFNGVMQSTTDSGIEVSAIQSAGTQRDIMIAVGQQAEPAEGDPVFVCKAVHNGFHVIEDGGAMTVNAAFGGWDASDLSGYSCPWGVLLHEKSAETAVNSAVAVYDKGATTTAGGYMMYQVFAGSDIAGTIKVQHAEANNDGAFSNLGGCTVSITGTDEPLAGIVPTTAITTTVYRYVRWQITITSGTTITFALAFVRG